MKQKAEDRTAEEDAALPSKKRIIRPKAPEIKRYNRKVMPGKMMPGTLLQVKMHQKKRKADER